MKGVSFVVGTNNFRVETKYLVLLKLAELEKMGMLFWNEHAIGKKC